jgi:hypothetical protein
VICSSVRSAFEGLEIVRRAAWNVVRRSSRKMRASSRMFPSEFVSVREMTSDGIDWMSCSPSSTKNPESCCRLTNGRAEAEDSAIQLVCD